MEMEQEREGEGEGERKDQKRGSTKKEMGESTQIVIVYVQINLTTITYPTSITYLQQQ